MQPFFQVPSGYERKTDTDSGNDYFVNIFTGVKWFSAKDDDGKVYYYEENGNESCWALPNVSQTIQDFASRSEDDDDVFEGEENASSVDKTEVTASSSPALEECEKIRPIGARNFFPGMHSSSKLDTQFRRFTLPVSSPNIQIGNVSIVVVKQGPLNKTKHLENGRKHRKNWSSNHVVLTDTFLLFFKDAKAFAAMQSGSNNNTKPDHCIDLKGAEVNWCKDKSRRSNVFEVTTLLGMTMLLQYDVLQVAAEWFEQINEVIANLNQKSVPPTPGLAQMRPRADSEDCMFVKKDSPPSASSTLQLPSTKRGGSTKSSSKVNRTKSLKMKILGSNEELDEDCVSQCTEGGGGTSDGAGAAANHAVVSSSQNKTNIREKLKKFFQKRPAMDDLFKRGIIKNEPVFGSTLRELQATDLSDVPVFVKTCIAEIEKCDRLRADGVYRQSGNLSTIQKIRFQVDQGNVGILETVDDVHVLTGALKLFFRELKEPLIPWEIVNKLLLAANNQSRKKKIQQMKHLVHSIPSAHKATLQYLLRHLVKVTEFKDKNRMQFSNLAIVFGPTLMWPPPSLVSFNLALDMMQQNIIVEALLIHVDQLF